MPRFALVLLFALLAFGRAFGQSATLTANPTSYTASAGHVTFTANITFTGAKVVGLEVNGVPAGWSFGSAGGTNPPSVAPQAGDTGTFAFTNIFESSSPVSFTFTVNHPAGLTGSQTFSAIKVLLTSGGTTTTLDLPNVTISPPPPPTITSGSSASGSVNSPFSYSITANGFPTSYGATGLPSWLSLNSSTGVISGTPTSSGSWTFSATATNSSGTSSPQSVTVTIGSPPTLNSASTASGTVGESFSYQISATGASSYGATGLPDGLSVNAVTGLISGIPTRGGTFSASVSAANGYGTAFQGVTMTIAGGNPPTITTQPTAQSVTTGGTFTFSVAATNATGYAWYRNDVAIAGATAATYSRSNAAAAHAGTYHVVVTNLSGSVTSAKVLLTVIPPDSAPTISDQPQDVTVPAGRPAKFQVTAAGTGTLSYQWRLNGSTIAGATANPHTVPRAWQANAGGYSVVVSNALGMVSSNEGRLTVQAAEYFGTLGTNGGSFALYVRPDRTGVFLAFARDSQVALVSKDLVFDMDGRFSVTTAGTASEEDLSLSRKATSGDVAGLDRARLAATEYVISGAIADDGSLSGAISGLGLSLSAPAAASGITVAKAGFYQSGASGSTATTYTIVGSAGEVYVATVGPGTADGGRGTIDASGNVSLTTEKNVVVSGKIEGNTGIRLTATAPGSTTPTEYTGGNPETWAPQEKLINISTRATAGAGEQTMIAGFSVSGAVTKRLLIRAVGPTLKSYGLETALATPYLKVYAGQTLLAENKGWASSAMAGEISTAGAQAGAFPLLAGSKDAALLMYVSPGVYTVHVTSTDGAVGVALVEVYEVK